MNRVLVLALLGLLAASGTASACSLVYQPFDDPTWDGMLRYVDGGELRAKDGARDIELASGFFITYAVDGETLVVSGQEGLGADCSGTGWWRVVEDGRVVRNGGGLHKVFDHPEGAILVKGRGATLLPWDGGAERDLPRLPDDVWVQAWSPALHPAYVDRNVVQAGARSFEVPAGAQVHAAAAPDGTGVLVVDETDVTLYHVADDPSAPVREYSWSAGEPWGGGLAWAGGWNVVAGGELYVLRDQVHRVDIGAEVVSVGARGAHALAFHQDGYVELDDLGAVSAAERRDGAWRSVSAEASAQPVASASHPEASGWSESAPDEGVETLPFPSVGALVVVLMALLARRRS